ncbi:hypothetical protein [Azospirillum sp. B506]|uniref:hypothetical protein n=1 Tax=Azospirillum sp. B506 TaxID=137721 RepID=UPI0005B2B8DB|nr:hypothetical protein [Azospirillum sp. B506]
MTMREISRIVSIMDYRTQLSTLAAQYASAMGVSEARVATRAMNDGSFFKRISSGGSCSVDVYLRLKQWFADHWPPDLEWPVGVDRPDVLPNTTAVEAGRARTGRRKPTVHPEGRAA